MQTDRAIFNKPNCVLQSSNALLDLISLKKKIEKRSDNSGDPIGKNNNLPDIM